MYSIKDGKSQFKSTIININPIIREAISNLNEKLINKNIRINLHLDKNYYIKSDAVILKNVILTNILSNSIKFSKNDSIINISVKEKQNYIEIIIQDFGIGIPDHILKEIFSFNSNTNRKGTNGEKGTGYGMPLIKKYTEVMDGSIKIESKENIGTSIILLLPKAH